MDCHAMPSPTVRFASQILYVLGSDNNGKRHPESGSSQFSELSSTDTAVGGALCSQYLPLRAGTPNSVFPLCVAV